MFNFLAQYHPMELQITELFCYRVSALLSVNEHTNQRSRLESPTLLSVKTAGLNSSIT